jgi:hypothetical protein
MGEYKVQHNEIVHQQITERIGQLSYHEAYEVLKFLDFIFYKREAEEDTILAKQIKEGLEDDFLDVESAKNYLITHRLE